jgi:hypothetical protein
VLHIIVYGYHDRRVPGEIFENWIFKKLEVFFIPSGRYLRYILVIALYGREESLQVVCLSHFLRCYIVMTQEIINVPGENGEYFKDYREYEIGFIYLLISLFDE